MPKLRAVNKNRFVISYQTEINTITNGNKRLNYTLWDVSRRWKLKYNKTLFMKMICHIFVHCYLRFALLENHSQKVIESWLKSVFSLGSCYFNYLSYCSLLSTYFLRHYWGEIRPMSWFLIKRPSVKRPHFDPWYQVLVLDFTNILNVHDNHKDLYL